MAWKGTLCLAAVLGMGVVSAQGLVSYSLCLLLTPTTLIFLGSLRSLQISPLVRGEEEEPVCLDWKTAVRLPIVAAITLTTCYFLVLSFVKTWTQFLFSVYFTILSVIAAKFYLHSFLEPLLPKSQHRTSWKVPFSAKTLHFAYTWVDFLTYFLTLSLGLIYFFTKNWLLNNLFASLFSLHALETTSINSFRTCAILLFSVCILDFICVFLTPILPTLLLNLDIPVKLLVPKTMDMEFAVIGLGDVVLPGLVVALAYRLDYFLACKKEKKGLPRHFIAGLVGYGVGLMGSVWAMWTAESAQPTLLYLLPSLAVWLYLGSKSSADSKALQTYKED